MALSRQVPKPQAQERVQVLFHPRRKSSAADRAVRRSADRAVRTGGERVSGQRTGRLVAGLWEALGAPVGPDL